MPSKEKMIKQYLRKNGYLSRYIITENGDVVAEKKTQNKETILFSKIKREYKA